MILRGIFYGTYGIFAGCMLSSTVEDKVKRNLVQPTKDFWFVLNDPQHFFMPEDLSYYLKAQSRGIVKMFTYESTVV